MRTHRAHQMGIAVLSVVALVASSAGPVQAVPPIDGSTLGGALDPWGVVIQPGDLSVVVTNGAGDATDSAAVFDAGAVIRNGVRTLTGVANPAGVAIHPLTGEVYVASTAAGRIHVFAPGATVPTAARDVVVPGPRALAFDTNGDLFVGTTGLDHVPVFAGGAPTQTGTVAVGFNPVGLAVHPWTRELYVGDAATDKVYVYPRGSSTPDGTRTLLDLPTPYAIAIHRASGRVYVADFGPDLVRVFEPGAVNWTPGAELTGLEDPRGIGIHPRSGDIYVADRNQDKVFVYPGPTMAVTSVAPTSGPVSGGTAVTITGVNVGAVSGVSFGGVAATNVVAVSPTQVTAVAPAHAVGTVDVAVTWGSKVAGIVAGFEYKAVAPAKATAVTGVPGNKQVTVSWTAPVDTGGVPVASYTVTPTPAGPACATTATSCTIGGLTNGTAYTFTVTTTNTASLSSISDPSPAVTPVIALSLKVQAKKASYRPPRWGTRTLVSWAKKPSNATRVVTRSCTNGTGMASSKLCRFTVSKSGKVKVRTRGYRNVVIKVSIVATPKPSAGPVYGPSPTWTRTWRVR